MAETDHPASVRALQDHERSLWILGVLAFGVGDVLTTLAGLRIDGVTEASPVAAATLDAYGFWGMVGAKLLALSLLAGFWRATPEPHAVGVPLGLALLGVIVVGWNSVVVLVAVLG